MTDTSINLPPNDYETITRPDGTTYYVCTMRQIVKHTIGLDSLRPYTRHGRKFYRPYRNYFTCPVDEYPWNVLSEAGYAKHGEVSNKSHEQAGISDDGMTTYWLTRKGLDWLGGQLGIHIHNEVE